MIDYFVVEILGKPYIKYDKWFLNIRTNAYGHVSNENLMFNTKEEALKIKVGDKYTDWG